MNVYGMYQENGRQAGFWIVRDTWGNTCAKVVEVGTLKGRPPYYGNPDVYVDIYDIHSGKLQEAHVLLSCPGTYSYRLIQPPAWSDEAAIDFEQGKILLQVPYGQNDDAKQLGAKWSAMLRSWWIPEVDVKALQKAEALGFLAPPVPRVYFRVPYNRRAEAQKQKARWEPERKLWSVAHDQEKAIAALTAAGFERVR